MLDQRKVLRDNIQGITMAETKKIITVAPDLKALDLTIEMLGALRERLEDKVKKEDDDDKDALRTVTSTLTFLEALKSPPGP